MTNKTKKHQKTKKHIAYRISASLIASLCLIIFTSVFYFLVLISIEYKSFPFVTKEIEKRINQQLVAGSQVHINKSYLKFSKLHKIEIKFDDIKLTIDGKKDLVLPKIEAEFSIFNLIVSKIIPSKLKIISPEIDIDNTSSTPKIAINGIGEEESLLQANLQKLSELFLSLKKGDVPIKNFSILDAKINLKNKNGQQIIVLKESQIQTFFADGILHLNSTNIIRLDPLLPDLLLNPSCQFKKSQGLKCSVGFTNFLPETFALIHPKLLPLKEITGGANGNINLEINSEYQLSKLSFDLKSKFGSFHYPQFFSKKIDFQNLNIKGNFDGNLKTFAIEDLSSNFGKTKFAMSLVVIDFMDKSQQKTTMQFKINNTPTNDLEVLWPLFLGPESNVIRKWVVEHIKDGVIKDGYATMSLQYKNGVQYLDKITSELAFSGLNLKYSEDFPKISNIDGIAAFSKQQMKIDISKADVLQSKISFATVIIPNFNAPVTMLNINGKLSGSAPDSLKHIGYKTEFANQIDTYFNGEAQTSVDIKLPLDNHLKLQDVYIKVASNIQNFNNDYIASDSNLIINTTKEFGNNNFITDVDLTNADIDLGHFNVVKRKGLASKINTIISFDKSNHLQLKNFNWKQENSSLEGNLLLQIDPLEIKDLKLKNSNFANSNFNLVYEISDKSRLIKLKGKSIDLRPFFRPGADNANDLGLDQKNDIDIDLDEVLLANNQKFSNVNINIDCQLQNCKNGFIRAGLGKNKNMNLLILPSKNNKEPNQISGTVDDISVIAKAFNLSNQINNGRAKIKADILNNGDLQGELKIDSGFTILKNEVVETISNSNIFANLKDKILNSNEIKFDDLKLEFVLKNQSLDINTLIASSYLMGFTAKGKIDFAKNEIALKGLIIPGYTLNKLFGIGQVPILGKIIVGEEGGGIFAARYDYAKKNGKGKFDINPASAVIPGGIRNVFDLF